MTPYDPIDQRTELFTTGGGGRGGNILHWGTVDAEIRLPSFENPELLQVFLTAVHATSTARNFFLPNPFSFLCLKPSVHFFLALAG